MGNKDEHFMNMKDGRLSGRPGSNKNMGMLDWVNLRRLDFHQKCNRKPKKNFTKKGNVTKLSLGSTMWLDLRPQNLSSSFATS